MIFESKQGYLTLLWDSPIASLTTFPQNKCEVQKNNSVKNFVFF